MRTLLLLSLLFLVGCQKKEEFKPDFSSYTNTIVSSMVSNSVSVSEYEPAYKVAERRYAQDRERRISEMQEAFERAIRSTGLDQLYQEKEEAIEEAQSIDHKQTKTKSKWRQL